MAEHGGRILRVYRGLEAIRPPPTPPPRAAAAHRRRRCQHTHSPTHHHRRRRSCRIVDTVVARPGSALVLSHRFSEYVAPHFDYRKALAPWVCFFTHHELAAVMSAPATTTAPAAATAAATATAAAAAAATADDGRRGGGGAADGSASGTAATSGGTAVRRLAKRPDRPMPVCECDCLQGHMRKAGKTLHCLAAKEVFHMKTNWVRTLLRISSEINTHHLDART